MSKVDQWMERLRRQRDELKLKMHLAEADAKQEWAEMETRFERLKARAEHSGEETERAFEDVGREIEKGYERIKRSLGS